jgi:hypothetical protein
MAIDLQRLQEMMDEAARDAVQLQIMTMEFNDDEEKALSNSERAGANLEGTIASNMK